MTAWVRRTGQRVLLCPSSPAGGAAVDRLLVHPLPPDIRARLVLRDSWWTPGEASSVLRRAVALVTLEDGAAIIAAANDTPVLRLHRPEELPRARMWRDIGLGGWLLDLGRVDGARIGTALMTICDDYARAQVDVHEAVIYARKLLAGAAGRLRDCVLSRQCKEV